MEMITCSQVCFRYTTPAARVDVLRGVDMLIQQGEHIAIIGPSGAGKSTLLRLCAAMDVPSSGNIHIGGQLVAKNLRSNELARFRREQIGLVFQHFSLLPTLSALENVMLPLLPYTSRRPLLKRAVSLLTDVGLASRLDFYPDHLSGGEQQRVAIARALIATPPLLLADEPTGSLDATTGMQMMEMLTVLCHEHQCTLVVVTHDAHIAALADRRLRMVDGQVEEA